MVIRQGDLYWLSRPGSQGAEQSGLRPYMVVQSDAYNSSKIKTVVVCALTANLLRARLPGNVLLNAGEADLSRSCVVNVTQLYSMDRGRFGERIGTLSRDRVREVLEGIRLVLEPSQE
jgi:mRNA interferase MazF